MDGRVLWHLGADLLEFGFLLVPGDGDAAALPGGDALLQAGVVEIAAQVKHAPKLPLLLRSRLEFVLECLAHCGVFHRYLFCLIAPKAARD